MDHFPIGTTEQFRSLWIVSFRNIYNLQLPKPEQGDVNCLSDNRLPDSLHVLNQGSFHYPLISDHLSVFLQFYGRQNRGTQIILLTQTIKLKVYAGIRAVSPCTLPRLLALVTNMVTMDPCPATTCSGQPRIYLSLSFF